MTSIPSPLRQQHLEQAAGLLSALAYPGRLRIMWLLSEHGELPVSELARLTGQDQSTLSHQLRVLRQARLVSGTRRGRQIIYHVNDQHVVHIIRDAIIHANE